MGSVHGEPQCNRGADPLDTFCSAEISRIANEPRRRRTQNLCGGACRDLQVLAPACVGLSSPAVAGVSTAGDASSERSTRLLSAPAREWVVQRFALEVIAGPDVGRRAEATSEEIAVGTADGSDLLLTDPTVSRQHLGVLAVRGGFQLRDFGSSNGTTLGGYRVERAWLKPGAQIVLGMTTLRFEVLGEPTREPLPEDEGYGRALGRSASMRRIFSLLPRIAASDASVLIEGETGTGKTLLADAIHQASPRAGKPFLVVDCGAITPSLVESELFGHERGAFTGAVSARKGAFQEAYGGTLLLDEIGELPLDLQPKLLRALEARVVRPVGASADVKLDVRVLAATHRDLRRAVNHGTFRADLFYRLHIVSLRLPPLRERPDDVRLLAQHFASAIARPGEPGLDERTLEELTRRPWPGNVRELRGAVERALLVGELDAGGPASTRGGASPIASAGPAGDLEELTLSFRAAKERAVAGWERDYLARLVERCEGNLSRAAREARMDRNHLRELLRRHGLTAPAEG